MTNNMMSHEHLAFYESLRENFEALKKAKIEEEKARSELCVRSEEYKSKLRIVQAMLQTPSSDIDTLEERLLSMLEHYREQLSPVQLKVAKSDNNDPSDSPQNPLADTEAVRKLFYQAFYYKEQDMRALITRMHSYSEIEIAYAYFGCLARHAIGVSDLTNVKLPTSCDRVLHKLTVKLLMKFCFGTIITEVKEADHQYFWCEELFEKYMPHCKDQSIKEALAIYIRK